MAIDWSKKTMYLARIKREATFFLIADDDDNVERVAENVFFEEEMGDGKVHLVKVTSDEQLRELSDGLDFASCMTSDEADPEIDLEDAFASIEAAKQAKPPEVVQAKAMRIETYDVEKAVGRHGEPLLLLRELPEGVGSLPEGLEYGGSYWVVCSREPKVVTYIQRGW